MRLLAVRLLNSEFDEEEREEREDGSLQEADEYFKHHERYRQEIRGKVDSDGDDNLACKNISEEPERERDDAYKLANELNEPNCKAYRVFEWILNEFAAVLPESDGEDASHFDDKEGDNSEYERDGEVGIRRTEERMVVILD